MVFCDLAEDMCVAEEFISYIVQAVLKERNRTPKN